MVGQSLRTLRRVAVASCLAFSCAGAALAVTIELKDVAPDRVERQRAAAVGNLPLPGTPDVANFEQRLSSKGLKAGDAMFIRIFKAESELEIWLRSGTQFKLLDVYPICHWSGTIGPKVHEGDKQTPEGFYDVTRQQLHLIGRHPRSLNLGFPNAFDKSLQRTGSYILVHGGCSSVGCFAMTNTVIAEVYDLAERALKSGQDRVPVHVFPFRMTDANMDVHASNEWMPFWRNLKEGYDAFEQTKVPPRIGLCERRYLIQPTGPGEVADTGPLAVCGEALAALADWDRLSKAAQLQMSRLQQQRFQQLSRTSPLPRLYPQPRAPRFLETARQNRPSSVTPNLGLQSRGPSIDQVGAEYPPANRSSRTSLSPLPGRSSLGAALPTEPLCDLALTSCRKWLALRKKVEAKALAMRDGKPAAAASRRTAARVR
jgi:murein L,D-transpeptidase YafK